MCKERNVAEPQTWPNVEKHETGRRINQKKETKKQRCELKLRLEVEPIIRPIFRGIVVNIIRSGEGNTEFGRQQYISLPASNYNRNSAEPR